MKSENIVINRKTVLKLAKRVSAVDDIKSVSVASSYVDEDGIGASIKIREHSGSEVIVNMQSVSIEFISALIYFDKAPSARIKVFKFFRDFEK